MDKLATRLLGQASLSQIASEVGWDFLKLGGEKPTSPSTSVAELGLSLCQTLQAAEAFVSGRGSDDYPLTENLPIAKRSMLIAERGKRDANITKYKAIADYACEQEGVLRDIVSRGRSTTSEELERLGKHFASLSLILAQVDL